MKPFVPKYNNELRYVGETYVNNYNIYLGASIIVYKIYHININILYKY